MEQKDDLPKSIIVILVILAVAISILGTFTVVSEINNMNSAQVYKGTPSQSAKISFTVVDPSQPTDGATAKVVFQVLER